MQDLNVCSTYKTEAQELLAIKHLPEDKRKKKYIYCNLYNTDKGFGMAYKRLAWGQNVELKMSEIQTNKNKLAKRGH